MPEIEELHDLFDYTMDLDGSVSNATHRYLLSDESISTELEALDVISQMARNDTNPLNIPNNLPPVSAIKVEDRVNDNTYKIAIEFSRHNFSASSNSSNDSENKPTESFDCGGGTKHLNYSLAQRKILDNSPDPGGAIGWNGLGGSEMSIKGVDVPTAQLRETYTKTIRKKDLTTNYKRKVAELVGKVNKDKFNGWEPGEVMFLGCSYSANLGEKVVVSFNFAIQPNETDKVVGGKKINKKGFEYAWALSKTVVDTQTNTPKVITSGIYVDKVCEEDSFACLGLKM